MLASQIRTSFLKYFENQGHTVVPSAPLIPANDPTLMFTSAGMVQFKDCFLGQEKRAYTRATTAQKCLRAGGKHNDLENVGFTARHHTFFEMLGNFSFGDYFKKDAIHFAWEFVTKNLGLPKDRLYVTVFNTDDEAAEIWHRQEGVPRDRIYRFGEKDNFWAAGDTGPCGPCSEIFVDRGEKYGVGPQDVMGGDTDRFMEIWNLVFMQYQRDAQGQLHPLAKPSIDTGAGLERLSSVLQGVDTNYDIDLFRGLLNAIADVAGLHYGEDPQHSISMRVIADHCRATNFLMADGVVPSNEGRGYVLRRIMRRAIRHGRKLGLKEPFFFKLTQALMEQMGDVYPELKDKRSFIQTQIKTEEERFLTTLENGLKVFEQSLSDSRSGQVLSGETAFKLYDTFGFPLDLTEVMAQERGHTVDRDGFQRFMEEQKARSRESWKGSGEHSVEALYKDLQKEGHRTRFVGYTELSASGKILALIHQGQRVNSAHLADESVDIIVDTSCFYAESGGQKADQGDVRHSHFSGKVVDVQKPLGDFIVLHVEGAQGRLNVGDHLEQTTQRGLRGRTARNHTATHMLHHSLRSLLGDHVKQAGSLVSADLLRFDFYHPKPLTPAEIREVEDRIQAQILSDTPVTAEETDKETALRRGAIAFFGDKYGDRVRVISVGDFSVELCGGTHVQRTSDLQGFKILNESGVAAGVRRIVAITGPRIFEALREKENTLNHLMDLMKVSAEGELAPKLEKLIQSEKDLRKSLEAQTLKQASSQVETWIQNAQKFGEIQLVSAVLPSADGDSTALLRELADRVRSQMTKTVVALGTHDRQKDQALLLVAVTKDIQGQIKAGDLVKEVAPLMDGRGGGKPDLAQAGGKDPQKLPMALEGLARILRNRG